MWSNGTEFAGVVSQAWQKHVQGTPMYCVVQKLEEYNLAKQNLDKCQTALHNKPTDNVARENENVARKELLLAQDLYFSFLKQKAKVEWSMEGDQNTAIFHRALRKRQMQNKIYTIQDIQGTQVDMVDIPRAFLEYYDALLGTAAT
ncbi:uncharacterized protein LOC110685257 [Chenopodium quinoa]|uniref:uncharacterized protein LOC110685257 n=1 Tax=Chenopodium quinoa TaxID=63459 RepID=UPI000B773501|nr:uncharacterized protein LOC110685257 [Chenopodium quinoa]